jgi:hypothetical protein
MRGSFVLFGLLYLALAFVLGSACGRRFKRMRHDAQKAHALRVRQYNLEHMDEGRDSSVGYD